MKTIIIIAALMAASIFQNSFAQDSASQPLKKVLTAYLGLKNALTTDNSGESQTDAEVLYNAINDVPMDKLTSDQHTVWMQYSAKLSKDAEHIKGSTDIDHHREHFKKLSANMYKLVKELNLNTADLYYQFCPMADDGKGAYWLSEDSEIRNPYMGKKMPSCGSTKETLNANK